MAGGKSRKTGQISYALIERLKREKERGAPAAKKKSKCGPGLATPALLFGDK